MELITSRHNAHFKQARKLAESARERHKTHRILLDGTRLINAYAEHFGLRDATLILSEQGAARADVQLILQSGSPQHVYVLANDLFAAISQIETPAGITAIAPVPRVEPKPPDDFRVLLEGVQDPGNLGGLLRTAAAAGATSAHLTKECADAWSPKSLRGGMGAQFVLAVRERTDLGVSLSGFRGLVIATSPRATKTIYEVELSGPVAMIFGSEGRGLPEDVASNANVLVHIPMSRNMESLNVAAAAAICCFERQRQVRGVK